MGEKKEYIERGAVIDILRKYSTENPSTLGRHSGVADIAMCEVGRLPAADVVEVVRCKYCKRSGMYAFGCGDREHLACLEIEEDGFVIMATAVNDNDYCSRGERREE